MEPESSVCSRNNKVHILFWTKFLFQLPESESSIVNTLSIGFSQSCKAAFSSYSCCTREIALYTIAWVLGFMHSMQLTSNAGKIYRRIRVRGKWLRSQCLCLLVNAFCDSDMLLWNILHISKFFFFFCNNQCLDRCHGQQLDFKTAYVYCIHLTFSSRCRHAIMCHGFAT